MGQGACGNSEVSEGHYLIQLNFQKIKVPKDFPGASVLKATPGFSLPLFPNYTASARPFMCVDNSWNPLDHGKSYHKHLDVHR